MLWVDGSVSDELAACIFRIGDGPKDEDSNSSEMFVPLHPLHIFRFLNIHHCMIPKSEFLNII
jgi:hypothetical protein